MIIAIIFTQYNSNTTLVKVKLNIFILQHYRIADSNTTLVKVKFHYLNRFFKNIEHSNTTLVKVKYYGKAETWTELEFKYNTC